MTTANHGRRMPRSMTSTMRQHPPVPPSSPAQPPFFFPPAHPPPPPRFTRRYKLCFGPKSFIVISEPKAAKHVLRDNSVAYNKGALAEILEDVMGKGLIPADPETWKVRRRAIVPAFHKAWLTAMVDMFGEETQKLVIDLDSAVQGQAQAGVAASGQGTGGGTTSGGVRDLEER